MLHTACIIGAVASSEALSRQCDHDFVALAALAFGAAQPGIEAAARDTERPAYQSHRPSHSVLRHEVKSRIDSLAK